MRAARIVLLVACLAVLAGCAAVMLRTRARTLDEFTAVRVRVYHVGLRTCRVEVVTASDTIQTGTSLCDVIPHRIR